MSQRRPGYKALSELVHRSSIWNSPGLSFEDRQALPDAFKRPPDDDPFRRDPMAYAMPKNDGSFQAQPLGQHKKDRHEQEEKSSSSKQPDQTGKPKQSALNEITESWIVFGRDSSCHGVKNIENKDRPKAARVIWLFITLAMMSGLIYSVILLIINYYEYRTVTRTEVKVAENMLFPSITLCNVCPYKMYAHGKKNPIEGLMAKTTIFENNIALNESSLDYQRTLNMSSEEIQQTYSYDIVEFLWYAVYEGVTLNLETEFEAVDTQFGRCFSFNGPKSIAKHGVRRVSYDGRYSGLRFMAHLFQSKYLMMDDMNAGLRMYISHYPETPRLDKDGIEIHPGTATKIALSPSKFTFLPPPYHSYGSEPCQETEHMDLREKMYDAPYYSYTACIEQCQDLHAARNCSCYNPALKVEGLPPCTVKQDFFCFKKFKNRIINNLMNVTCDCPRPCTFYRYDMTISSSQMPSRASSTFILGALGMPLNSVEILRENYLDVRVYLQSNVMREETHEAQYTFTSILAYLGGQMGFFLGASLVTLSELVETVLISSYVFFKKKVVEMGKMDVQQPVRAEDEKKSPKEVGKY